LHVHEYQSSGRLNFERLSRRFLPVTQRSSSVLQQINLKGVGSQKKKPNGRATSGRCVPLAVRQAKGRRSETRQIEAQMKKIDVRGNVANIYKST
jgi:hypothetical protein